MNVDLRALIGKLNPTTRGAVEAAAGLCLSRTHYDVEIEHWLLKLIEDTDTDAAALFRFFGVDVSRLTADLTRVIDQLNQMRECFTARISLGATAAASRPPDLP